MGLDPLTLTLAAVSTISQGVSIYKGQQADKQARKAADLSRRQEAFKALRERRDFIRQARTTAAKINQGAENAGASLSSAAQGGMASIISQAASGLSFLDQYNAFSTQIGQASSKASKFSSQANLYAGLSNLTGTGAKMSAQFGSTPTPVRAPQGPPVS